MKAINNLMTKLDATPKLRLGRKLEGGGVELLGPKHIKILGEPSSIMGKDPKTGLPRQEMKFMVEHEGRKYRWLVPFLSKDDGTQPHYLVERMSELDIQVGDELILEMKRNGPKNYVEITKVSSGEVSEAPSLDEDEDTVEVSHEE